jgi:hypothetical protein
MQTKDLIDCGFGAICQSGYLHSSLLMVKLPRYNMLSELLVQVGCHIVSVASHTKKIIKMFGNYKQDSARGDSGFLCQAL